MSDLRVGLLGAGWFGREAHLKNLLQLEGVRVVAASSRSAASLDAVRAIAGEDMHLARDWREIVDDDQVDAVIIALTNDQHHPAALAALAAGKHVLCEKPLGLSLTECDEIIAAAESADRVLQVGHEMRFQQLYVRMKEWIDRGEIGTPQIIWCREYRGPMRPGWRSRRSLTGGMILEKNCHHFDLFHWLTGQRAVRVLATGGRNVLTDREILDNAQVLVEFDNGLRGVLEICLFAPFGGDTEIGLVGDAGRIDSFNQRHQLVHHRFDAPEAATIDVAEPTEEVGFQDASGRIDRGIHAELEHFVACCRSGATPLTDGRSARHAVAICLAAQQSIATGRPVDVG